MAHLVWKAIIIYIILCLSSSLNKAFEARRFVDYSSTGELVQALDFDGGHCDMNSCDTVVIKCRETGRCQCNVREDARCAKDCVDCLEEKFGKCCACVGLCPVPAQDTHSAHVGDIGPVERWYDDLFETLTDGDDIHGRWLVERRLVLPDATLEPEHKRNLESEISKPAGKSVWTSGEDTASVCTMAFVNKYLNMVQCRRYCKSMGAARYRWFEDGCCECLSRQCTNYGSERPKCRILPL